MKRGILFSSFLLLGFLAGPLAAQDASQCAEHPMIRPFPGSELQADCDYKDFDEFSFWVRDAQNRAVQTKEQGKYWHLRYVLWDSDHRYAEKSHSVVEYRENYRRAALEKGGKILYENEGYLTFTLPGEDGSTTWVQLHVLNYSHQTLDIIEVAPMVQSMTFGPAEMKAALDADGKVALHGILFDLDKATLQVESDEQLQHIVALMKNFPDLRLQVCGHTDDQGDDAYNMTLSQRRAETVVNYLSLFGIDAGRLTPKGFGESEPVASNATEEGRAQNRRVELVKVQ